MGRDAQASCSRVEICALSLMLPAAPRSLPSRSENLGKKRKAGKSEHRVGTWEVCEGWGPGELSAGEALEMASGCGFSLPQAEESQFKSI